MAGFFGLLNFEKEGPGIDKNAPKITVDTEYEQMPTAVVGGKYPIPTASAIDEICGVTPVKVSVWYDYGGKNQKMVDCCYATLDWRWFRWNRFNPTSATLYSFLSQLYVAIGIQFSHPRHCCRRILYVSLE